MREISRGKGDIIIGAFLVFWGASLMGYIDETLGSDEKILHPVEFHWTHMFVAYCYLLIAVASLLMLSVSPFALIFFVSGILLFIYRTIQYYSTERALTNRRVIQKKGFIARKVENISLQKIEEANLSQSIQGRLLGYGTVRLSGTGIGKIVLKDIDDPLKFMKSLNDARL